MSVNTGKLALSAVVHACWEQWRPLLGDGVASDARPARSIIDPEALVLASLAVMHEEARLADRLRWWAARGSSLLSVQRLMSLTPSFPERLLESEVPWFAAHALDAGDTRWARYAGSDISNPPEREIKGPDRPQLIEPSTLMLRLRAGFGVGTKADLMAFLIGATAALRTRDVSATVSVIAKALSCSPGSVRRAASDMTLARFVEASGDQPVTYSVDAQAWASVLELHDPFRTTATEEPDPVDIPAWRFWDQTFGLLIASLDWDRDSSTRGVPRVVRASSARDVAERFPLALRWTGLERPGSSPLPGEGYLQTFDDLVDRVAEAARRP